MRDMIGKFDFVTLPLTAKVKGNVEVPQSAQLNWGQRIGREQNQAYLPVPAYIQRSMFFPDIGQMFELECDDGELFQCVRAQTNGKAIHTPSNNSLLGVYFRRRLGVELGYSVNIEHLRKYGRSSVDIYKLAHGRYYMDFSRV
jgi:hypothetical protein